MTRAIALVVFLLAAAPAAADQRTLTLVSTSTPDGFAELGGLSADGNRVFVRTDQRLSPGDTDAASDIYEAVGGTFVPVSDGAGPDAAEEMFIADLSHDGAVVVLATEERLAATDTDTTRDVYARTAAGFVHVSDGPGADGNEQASHAGLSADGATVAFTTRERLAASDTDSAKDVYARTLGGPLVHVSDDGNGADAEWDANFRAVSRDGERIVFSTAESLADTDTDTMIDGYELAATGLSHLTDGPGADGAHDADPAAVTPDGSRVYFLTAESLAPTDTDAKQDLYERTDRGFLTHVSDNPTGPDNELTTAELIGTAGGRVWLRTRERLAASDTDDDRDVYEVTPARTLVQVLDRYAEPIGWTPDGTHLYLETADPLLASDRDSAIDLYERGPNGALRHVSAGSDGEHGAYFSGVSDDGRRVLFATVERLVPGDTDSTGDIYERTPAGGLIAVTDGPGPDLEENANLGGMSPDGTRLYVNAFDRLTGSDTDDGRDLYLSAPPAPPSSPRPPSADPRDTTPPRLTGVRVVRKRLRFTLSEPARVRITVRGRTRTLDAWPAGTASR